MNYFEIWGELMKISRNMFIIFVILLIVIMSLYAWKEYKFQELRAIEQLSEQTNQVLFSLISLQDILERPDWENEKYQKEVLQSLKSFHLEASESFNVANQKKRYLPDEIYVTVHKLNLVTLYIYDTYEEPLREIRMQDPEKRQQTALNLSNDIKDANFKNFTIDPYTDKSIRNSWHYLNTELNKYIETNIKSN